MTVNQTANNPASTAVPPGLRTARPQEWRVELKNLPTWVRPEVIYWYSQWLKIRDACAGERQIKELRTYYLPAMDGMDPGEYDSFAQRATYYNFSSRTVSSMSGSIFRRQPLIEGLPADMLAKLKHIAKDRAGFETFASGACEDIVRMGRYGVLLDLSTVVTTTPRPYFVEYTAENILDWDEGEDKNGDTVTVRWVLRESNDGRNLATDARKVYVRYRELKLEPGPFGPIYTQYVYAAENGDATLDAAFRGPPIVPLVRGKPLDYIPFKIFGPHVSSPKVEKPPLEDIALLNLSHYRSYASLEHARFFVGFPIYTAEEPQGGGDVDYQIGSSRVWIVPPGGKAGILEMNGQGLKFLENACSQKEMQAVSIGSKMLGANAGAPAKTPDQLVLEERNEQSILLKITRQLDAGFTLLLQWWAQWQGMSQADSEKIVVTFNKDFLYGNVGAREFRAVHAMYKDNVIPVQVLFYYCKQGNMIPDWMRVQDFIELLKKTSSFPGQPDSVARIDNNYASRQQQLTHEEKLDGIDIQQQEIDLQKEVQDAADAVNQATQDLAEKQQTHQMAMDKKAAATADKVASKPTPARGVQPVAKVSKPSTLQPGVKPTGKV